MYIFLLVISNCHPISLEVLIPHLPNVNVTDRAGRTSLQHAVYNGHVQVQRILPVPVQKQRSNPTFLRRIFSPTNHVVESK